MKQAHNIDFKDKKLEPLVMLLSLIMMDLHKQAQKMQQEEGREHPEGDREISDEVDGFFTQQVDILLALCLVIFYVLRGELEVVFYC